MPYGNKKPKKMSYSGGGPHMYNVGSKEKNSPMNFSDKAMNYMKNMPAMYGKPKMDGDPVKPKAKKDKSELPGLPATNKERVQLLKDFRAAKGAKRPEYGELVTFANEQKKKKQAAKKRTKNVTNEFRMRQAYDKLGGGATKNQIEAIRDKYDPDRKITNRLIAERKKKNKNKK